MFPLIIDEDSVIPSQLPGACVQVWKLGPIPIITIQSRLIPPPLSSASLQILSQIFKRQRSLPELGAESSDKWSRELNFINVRNYDQRSLNRYWHSPSATFTAVRQSKPKNCQFMKNWRYHRIMVKIGHETIFYILSKNSNDKKGFRFEASLIKLPDTWKHCLSPKRFYQISLKICKAVFVAGFYPELRGVLSPWLLSTVTRSYFRIHLNHSHIHCTVKVVKRLVFAR